MPIFWQVELGALSEGSNIGSQTAFQNVGVIFGKDVVCQNLKVQVTTPHRESMNRSK